MAKIILAEDDSDMRRFLVKALQNAGYDVTSFDNGLSAYNRLREEPFALLLSDDWEHGVEAAVDIALLGRYYERIADHAVSVGNRVVFVVTGELPVTSDR